MVCFLFISVGLFLSFKSLYKLQRDVNEMKSTIAIFFFNKCKTKLNSKKIKIKDKEK